LSSRLLRLILMVVVAGATTLRAQSILTAAGGGTLDGQRALDIPTFGPRGIAVDPARNVYIAVSYAQQVLRIDAASGIVATIAGNGAAGFIGDGGLAVNAAIREPGSIALDADGNVYIADTANNRVRRVDAKTRFISTYAGGGTPPEGSIGDDGPATAATVARPFGLAVFAGSLYITEQDYNANRVRRVDMATGKITTIAGATDGSGGGFGGDGGPAKNALLDTPLGIAADAAGNLYVADYVNKRVRRIDTGGTISTYAQFESPTVVALDGDGNLLVAADPGIHKVDKTTHAITSVVTGTGLIHGMAVDNRGRIYFSDGAYDKVFTFTPGDAEQVTFAGGGNYVGDGRKATAGILHSPHGLAFDAAGNLIIVDRDGNLLRKVSAADGTLSTIAGIAGLAYAQDQEGTNAKDAVIGFPVDVEIDGAGNIYLADLLNARIWLINTAGKISTYAGGGNPADGVGDGGAATAAKLSPQGISLDRLGNLYIADADNFATPIHARIRKVDAQTKVISTVAGGAELGYAGDGGPATQAKLDTPVDAIVDNAGVMFIADSGNGAIRRVDATGKITTYAGHKQDGEPVGDGGPAANARLTPLHMFLNRTTDDLYVADFSNHRVRRIDRNGIITTVAGSAQFYYDGGYGGDNGPATDARLNFDYGDFSGIALSASGDLYFSDSANNRVRVVSACRAVGAPPLTAPSNNATGVATSPRLTWGTVAGAFRYDVLLDTVNPPARTIATDIEETQFTPANLLPNTTYFWAVAAKSDRFCPSAGRSTSPAASFITAAGCGAGAFDITTPAEGSPNVNGTPLHLAWQPSAGASSYDVYLGTTNPPPLVATVTQTSFDTTARGANFWFVVAHASCDATETASTPIHTFTAPAAVCPPGASIAIAAPVSGATNVATTVDLTWTLNGAADAIDVFFGTSANPPLLRAGLASDARTLSLPALAGGPAYFWRVVARGQCFQGGSIATPVATFTTRTCAVPGATSIAFAPGTVTAGSTYAIVWTAAPGLDAEGGYLVERATSPSFSPIADTQVVSSTAASFIAGAVGTYYHRVRALPSCDPANAGPPSDARSVTVVNAPPNVVFTVQPQAVITGLGERLEDRRGSFTVENIGSSTVSVIVARQELAGSKPFFSIAGDAAFITLEPRKPRTFAITYSGPRTDVAGSYQGVIVVSALGQGFAVTPYAFVNLKVGGGASATPQFQVDGVPADYAAFGGVSGDDSGRAPLQVTLRNPGTTPMELGAEIGPEVWLAPEAGWNDAPLAAGASRTIRFSTQRTLAPSGPLPRYTYFTVRTKDGASARLLVQDNDRLTVGVGRTSALNPAARSFIVPQVVSETASGGARLVSRLRLSNIGGDSVQAELIFTPAGGDGFDAAAVKRTVIVLPPNDVVTLTDPLVQIFGLARPAAGQIEVRLPRDRTGLVNVRAGIAAIGAPGGFDTPVVTRGDGATATAPHVITLLPSSNFTLTLAETSGSDAATARVTLMDGAGNTTSSSTQLLPRYGMVRLSNLTATRVEIRIESGGGAVIGLATIASANGASGATVLSTPAVSGVGAATALLRALWKQSAPSNVGAGFSRPTPVRPAEAGRYTIEPDDGIVSVTTVVPVLATPSSAGAAPSYRTALGLVAATGAAANFSVYFHESAGGNVAVTRTVNVPGGATQVYGDVLAELLGLPTTKGGSVYVQGPPGAKVYAVVQSSSTPGGAAFGSSYLTLPTTVSEALTSAGSSAQRPLFYDGLEQSTDPTRGTRWMLVLNETSGAGGTVNVRLYEAANRTSPIGSLDVPVAGYQQKTLDTVFSELGLDEPDRRKDRTNVQVVVTAVTGNARVSAAVVSVDNQTGDTKAFPLAPAVGSGTPNVSFVAPVVTTKPAPSPRHRGVRH
jgi:sugar lactone lactonase YvrE